MGKLLAAIFAAKQFLDGVDTDMPDQGFSVVEPSATFVASEPFFAEMNFHVFDYCALSPETSSTFRAAIIPTIAGMCPYVRG